MQNRFICFFIQYSTNNTFALMLESRLSSTRYEMIKCCCLTPTLELTYKLEPIFHTYFDTRYCIRILTRHSRIYYMDQCITK